MAKLSRRSFIGQAGRISAFCAMSSMLPTIGCRREERTTITLNVVLHGLFVLDFQDSGIELLTPFVEDHIYRAGNWHRPAVFDLGKDQEYRLRGTDPIAAAPLVDPDCNVVLRHPDYDFDVNSELSHFIVQLPFPAAIHSLRCIPDSSYRNTDRSGNGDPTTIEIYALSLCQALVYPVSNYHDLELLNTSWSPRIDPSTDSANLHFWAEPEKRFSPAHAKLAYEKLDDLLPPLHMKLATDKVPPLDADTGVRGLPTEEEQGWAEWQNAGEGSHPTNCCGVMANAPAKPGLNNFNRRPIS